MRLISCLYERICLESIAFRWTLIELWATAYTKAERYEMYNSFKSDADRLNITRYGEGFPLAEAYKKWGLN